MRRKYAVVEPGLVPDELVDRFGDYPTMVRNWLANHFDPSEIGAVSPAAGEPLCDPSDYDGYIITGSKYGVHDDVDWMEPLMDFIRALYRESIPLIGICFGHQAIAQALGGHAAYRGWICGNEVYPLRPGHGLGDFEALSGAAMHQDQVERIPECARVLAGNENCRYGFLAYDRPIMSIQYHPEIGEEFLRALLDYRSDSPIPFERVERAKKSLQSPVDPEKSATVAARLLKTRQPL